MIKKIYFILLIVSLAGNVLGLHGQSSQENSAIPKDWETYSKSHVILQYPKGWVMDKSGANGTVFILRSPVDSTNKLFTANLNLIKQDLKGQNMDLDKFVDLSLNQIKTLITNSVVLESKRMKVWIHLLLKNKFLSLSEQVS